MGKMFKRVLIANRGEIAVRIIRTLRELGIESVAVYSEADINSYHRHLADFAVALDGRSSAESYLNIDQIIEAAKNADADAIHPGYGFLSENAEFVRKTSAVGITFIGPSAEAMDAMGDKISAKKIMKEQSVATVPGSDEAIQSSGELHSVIDEIGLPVILKAAAGGGGRGMRVIHNRDEADSAFEACQREALSYFGNDTVFVERFIEHPRHIEVQILCDATRGIHLYERDCSIQRRHQKLLEEAPSQYLNEAQRQELGKLAVKAALAVGYEGAGTVEFICESPDKAYFMEMNTRIQVEHPVTEMVTGIDLIAEQIHIASGEPLRWRQEQIKLNGWSIEARINAEDAQLNFMPAAGQISRVTWPMGSGVRIDSHIYDGYSVPSEYDSMLAKLIVWAQTRDEAISKLKRCLRELNVDGIPTTALFHYRLIDHKDFKSGNFSTRFLEENMDQVMEAKPESGNAPISSSKWNSLAAALSIAVSKSSLNNKRAERASFNDSRWQEAARRENNSF